VIHCRSHEEALKVKRAVEERLRQCKLEAHPDKTRLVYCRDSNREQDQPHIQFDFLGYGFKPRRARNSRGGREPAPRLGCGNYRDIAGGGRGGVSAKSSHEPAPRVGHGFAGTGECGVGACQRL